MYRGMNSAPNDNWQTRISTALAAAPPDGVRLYASDDRRRRALPTARKAAVVIAIIGTAQPHIVLTQRGAQLRSHPGQISFPGGRIEANDADAQAAAMREAHEEIGLNPADTHVLGRLPDYVTSTGFDIAPFVAWLSDDSEFVADGVEVARIFGVPLTHAMNSRNYRREHMHIGGRERAFHVIEYDGNYIWGATAAMLHGLCACVSMTAAA